MQGGDSAGRPSSATLIPIAAVAVGVLVLALALSGSRTGTIVVERIALSFTTTTNGKTLHPRPITVTTINETSADGVQQRSFTSTSTTRPGYQQVLVGDAMQLYDPADNTVYETTEEAQQRALNAQLRRTAPKGTHVGTAAMHLTSSTSVSFVPGRMSAPEQELRAGRFKVAGRTRIDGRLTLKLVQSHSTELGIPNNSADYASRSTFYVTPANYYPVAEVIRTSLPSLREYVVTRWLGYRVLPATAANQRLLSLTARHPHARVVHIASAFLRASQSEVRTSVK